MGKVSILKGMKWKQQKDTSLAYQTHFVRFHPEPKQQLGLDNKVEGIGDYTAQWIKIIKPKAQC